MSAAIKPEARPHDTLVGIKIVFRIARHLEIEGSGHPPERRDLLEVLQPIQNLLLRRLDVLDGNDVASQSIAADRMNDVKKSIWNGAVNLDVIGPKVGDLGPTGPRNLMPTDLV